VNPHRRAAEQRGDKLRPAAYLGWAIVMIGYRVAPEVTTRVVATVALKMQERRLDREREEATRPRLF